MIKCVGMPILKHAIKKLRVDKRKTKINKVIKTKARKAVKVMVTKPSAEALKEVFSAIDRAAKKRVIHPKKADRIKSRLSKMISVSEEKEKKAPVKKKVTTKKVVVKKTTKAKK